MNWVVEHRVCLDYVSKRVTLKVRNGKEVVIVGELQDYLSNVISAMVADKLVRKECDAYFAFVYDTSVVGLAMKRIQTIRGFSNIFSEELHGLALDRKVELEIEILHGTA